MNSKKLVRGLKDVSSYFVSPTEIAQNNLPHTEEKVIAAKQLPVQIQNVKEQRGIVSCFTVLPPENFSAFLSDPQMISAFKKIYNELYVLSSLSQKTFTEAQNSLQEVALTSFQVEDLIHPEFVKWSEKNNETPSKNLCFFINPALLFKNKNLFQMLDRAILWTSATSPESIARAYQMLGACLHENPQTRFFLFVSDINSDEALEMVCERFAEITSRFMGCEIDFLGYQTGAEICINEEILHGIRALDEVLKDSIKSRLTQMSLHESMLEIK